MSVATWNKKYYPVGADDPKATKDAVAAVKHSLRKWQGLTKANLMAHGIHPVDLHDKKDNDLILISGESCALCTLYYGVQNDVDKCPGCPLFEVRGGVKCDKTRPDESISPYSAFGAFDIGSTHRARPMIMWLKRALVYAQNAARKK